LSALGVSASRLRSVSATGALMNSISQRWTQIPTGEGRRAMAPGKAAPAPLTRIPVHSWSATFTPIKIINRLLNPKKIQL